MDTPIRTLAKAICWQALGICTMTGLGYLFTGSLSQGGAIAVTSSAVALVTYVLHERLWERISWGRRPAHSHRGGATTEERGLRA
ncbi:MULTISPECIES: DUF2061 domain-containing protein [unclassified Roseivivax]|uniref:DUF2061 domain-containing protein n=1 Tax=Roseivivax sp. GX 12232 TaxID=2900547 RepID=UPI001E59B781|nr:DUF2061 domain-containing protein [Roseivivax sp. GX 12232]MCE0505287.1 DUF2061 domain-containing protein [Roseivivax sp. GX 12232]